VWVSGAGAGIAIRDNVIHDLRGVNSMGIAVFGTRRAPIRNLTIAGNVIHDVEAAPSEALVVNGNVAAFTIADNRVHDVNNIGIDVIGGERDVHPSAVPRDGLVTGNLVERARSNYGGGFAAGIYVDGARRIRIEGNTCIGNDLGIEVGAEHRGFDALRITVTGNTIRGNEKAGLVFGGYGPGVGRTRQCVFAGNVIAGNDTARVGHRRARQRRRVRGRWHPAHGRAGRAGQPARRESLCPGGRRGAAELPVAGTGIRLARGVHGRDRAGSPLDARGPGLTAPGGTGPAPALQAAAVGRARPTRDRLCP
jgi:hypothetical protein